jgi:hypothetical protein
LARGRKPLHRTPVNALARRMRGVSSKKTAPRILGAMTNTARQPRQFLRSQPRDASSRQSQPARALTVGARLRDAASDPSSACTRTLTTQRHALRENARPASDAQVEARIRNATAIRNWRHRPSSDSIQASGCRLEALEHSFSSRIEEAGARGRSSRWRNDGLNIIRLIFLINQKIT